MQRQKSKPRRNINESLYNIKGMTCCKCGAPDATIHLTQIVNGESETRDYCEKCAPNLIQESLKKLKRPAMEGGAQFQARYEKIHSGDPRFARKAYEFVLKSLSHALEEETAKRQGFPPHRTARQLIEACESLAKRSYGKEAGAQLKAWGVQTSGDIGDIVFHLVENGFLGKKPEETRADFDGLPFLEERFF
jgi:uncharacterized repeat protein (TIGR04138 family)